MTPPLLAVGGALALDALVGEPPQRVHPVAWFGRLVPEREWRRPRAAGLCIAIVFPLAAAASVGGVVLAAGRFGPLAAAVTGAVALFVTTSLRRLLLTARRVAARSDIRPDDARRELRALAGRDASTLSPAEVRSAAVESIAENLADGLVGPLLWYALPAAAAAAVGWGPVVAVAAGTAGAAWAKAVNTLDSMLGYRSVPAGWAVARLDDAVMWVPARAGAVLLAAVAAEPGAPGRARRWLSGVSSPNSGWPMGTLAAVLGVRLEKPGAYVLNPGAPLPTVGDARRAVRRVGVAGLAAYLLAGVIAWL
ncbi:MAG: CobD/CbiB family cobalamin biosynthesis protein [Salinirussus sp.]